jgi:hypothetical protein
VTTTPESIMSHARYRDADCVVQVEPTSCRDETAARQVLATIELRLEKVRSGLMSQSDDRIAADQAPPIEDHFTHYPRHLQAKNTTTKHRKLKLNYLRRIASECGFRRLPDLSAEKFEGWIAGLVEGGVSARTKTYSGSPW